MSGTFTKDGKRIFSAGEELWNDTYELVGAGKIDLGSRDDSVAHGIYRFDGDTRLTIMAALALADELSEVKEKLQRLEPELATLQDASVVSADRAQATQAAVVAALNAAAERIEGITRRLNQTVTDGGVPMG